MNIENLAKNADLHVLDITILFNLRINIKRCKYIFLKSVYGFSKRVFRLKINELDRSVRLKHIATFFPKQGKFFVQSPDPENVYLTPYNNY